MSSMRSHAVRPADHPPPVDVVGEFVTVPTDPEGERIEVGVVIVGGGPAGLACAIRLMQLLETEPALAEALGEVPVALVEKGKATGSHLLSGAMMKPSAMRRLFPGLDEREWPTYGTVAKDDVYLMTRRRALRLPRVPPPFRNHGNHVTSVAQLGRWLGRRAEEAGVYVLPETAAVKLLVEDGVVLGVRTGDKGRGRDGQELSNFEPGSDLIGRATVLAEGTQGHLSGVAIRRLGLGSPDPQGMGAGGQGGLAGAQAPRPRRPHDGLAAADPAAKYSRVRRVASWYPMGEDKISLGLCRRARLPLTRRSPSHDPPAGAQDPPVHAPGPSRGGRADPPGAPRRSRPAATCAMPRVACVGTGDGHRGRLRRAWSVLPGG